MFIEIGDRVEIIDDIYEEGIEKVAFRGEYGIIRAITEDGNALVEFDIGRVVKLHPVCFKIDSHNVQF